MKPPLFGIASQLPATKGKLPYLKQYNEVYLGLNPDTDGTNQTGESTPLAWKAELPTAAKLCCQEFGPPRQDASFTQEGCMETSLHLLLSSGYLPDKDRAVLLGTHVLVKHLDKMRRALLTCDFRWIRNIDKNWENQTEISSKKSLAMLACLFHYNLDVSLLMRYLGQNYTAAHRDVQHVVERISPHVDSYLIPHFIRVMTAGCPNVMNAESTRENSVKYWRAGNNPSIAKHLPAVMKTMNKEERNKFVIPLPMWMWRFIPHLHFTPHHYLLKNDKARMIFDAKYRHDAMAIAINMMTSDASETELECQFGRAKLQLLIRVWNLRITYPYHDIVLHANDVKSCFRQLKHHPDVMGAFSYILGDFLFLQCGLTFGSDFSPANWEVVRRIAEQLAEAFFEDKSLVKKHRKHIDKLRWRQDLGSKKAQFTRARACALNPGVLDTNGKPASTPHAFFVDDDIYSEVFDVDRIEQAVAASIEAIFVLLGESDLLARQDPISFDKMEDMMVSYYNQILGQVINTRKMTVETPPAYVSQVVKDLERHWHPKRKSVSIPEIESLTGQLGHISDTAPWLRFLLSQLYMSLAVALGFARAHLICTSKDFRMLLKQCAPPGKAPSATPLAGEIKEGLERSFALSTTAKKVHHSNSPVRINKSLKRELRLIRLALASEWVSMSRPIGHFVPREPSGTGWADSCLLAAGGFSIDMGFWWYIEWPEEVRALTLRFVKNNKDGTLISINALEYAALIINYVAACHHFLTNEDCLDPHPSVLLFADNTAAESWAIKGCKSSAVGRHLGLLQCALMINNPVGISTGRVSTKANIIADRISRVKKETNILPSFHSLMQDFPQLKSCCRFHPSAELVSLVTGMLLQKSSVDPLEASRRLLAGLGRITT